MVREAVAAEVPILLQQRPREVPPVEAVLDVEPLPQQNAMGDREVRDDQGRLGELARDENAAEGRFRPAEQLMAQLGDRLDVHGVLVLALDQKGMAMQMDNPVDLLQGLATRR